jgi:hypothetical protein
MEPTSLPATSSEQAPAYRSAADRNRAEASAPDTDFEEKMHPIVFLVGVASLVRVVGALLDREVFGAEATVALMTFVAVAWYALAVHGQRRASTRSGRSSHATRPSAVSR